MAGGVKSLDARVALCFALLGLGVSTEALRFPGKPFDPGGAILFPLLGGLSLLGLAVILFLQSRGAAGRSLRELFARGEAPRVIFALGAFFVAAMVMEAVGYVLSMLAFVAVLLRVIGRKGVGESVLYGAGMAVATYLLFSQLLGVRLPRGVLPF